MKKRFIIANWKSHKTQDEVREWVEAIAEKKEIFHQTDNLEIIICAPFTLLHALKQAIEQHELPIKIGAQDISPFAQGAYTGEVNGRQIKEFADYVIIGHSERREHFHEDDAMLFSKVTMAEEFGLTPIFCISEKGMPIPKEVHIVAYEPLFAIGSGHPDTPENADTMGEFLKKERHISTVIYGGSVVGENVANFLQKLYIDGVLPGGASLLPETFLAIVQHA